MSCVVVVVNNNHGACNNNHQTNSYTVDVKHTKEPSGLSNVGWRADLCLRVFSHWKSQLEFERSQALQ